MVLGSLSSTDTLKMPAGTGVPCAAALFGSLLVNSRRKVVTGTSSG